MLMPEAKAELDQEDDEEDTYDDEEEKKRQKAQGSPPDCSCVLVHAHALFRPL